MTYLIRLLLLFHTLRPKNKRRKYKGYLKNTGGKCYIKNINGKYPPLNKPILIKLERKKEDDIKAKLIESNDNWNEFKLQVHWDKL